MNKIRVSQYLEQRLPCPQGQALTIFFNDGAMRIKERRWSADQKIKETPDWVILSFTSTQYGKILELVLANGRDALPL